MMAGIVIAIDVSEAFFLRDLMPVRFCFAEIFPVQNDCRAEFLAIVYLNEGRKFRHHHRRRNPKQLPLISKRLSVIASGRGDDAALLLVGRQLCEGIPCTALLKTSRALQVVELAEDLHAGDFAERDGRRARRIVNGPSNAFARRFDVLEGDHQVNSQARPGQLPIAQWESGMGCNSRNPNRAGDRI